MKSSEYLLRIASAELEKKLANKMPAPETIPARDHVLANLETIKRARDAGWSIKQIHAELEACGVSIEFNTFRKYVSDYAPTRRAGREPAVMSPVPPRVSHQQPEVSAVEEATPAPRFASRFRSAGL